ncbi:hypothetical protein J437_LFUL014832 [Ladona fulva]|uniref:Uncharacterized protein n=1 Tax=Ladona fulva TaxID=123851 RepID=A0A8K0P8L7_LADFU|nr:hypothetical protein J437_LFUL014832 [Ladona fulva]
MLLHFAWGPKNQISMKLLVFILHVRKCLPPCSSPSHLGSAWKNLPAEVNLAVLCLSLWRITM